jgi:hypothetical protein
VAKKKILKKQNESVPEKQELQAFWDALQDLAFQSLDEKVSLLLCSPLFLLLSGVNDDFPIQS